MSGNQHEEVEELRQQLAVEKATQKYTKMGLTERMSRLAASAEVDNDFDTMRVIMSGHLKAIKAQAEAKAAEDLKQRQPVKPDQGKPGTLTAIDRARIAARHSMQDTAIIDYYKGLRKRG